MNTTQLINAVAIAIGATSYLEIGARNPEAIFDKIKVEEKTGVNLQCKSDGIIKKRAADFFAEDDKRYDLIFVDGDRRYSPAAENMKNAIKALMPKGVILLANCMPESEGDTDAKKRGDIWRVFAHYRKLKSYHAIVINGVGLIWKAKKGDVVAQETIDQGPWVMSAIEQAEAFGVVAAGYVDAVIEAIG